MVILDLTTGLRCSEIVALKMVRRHLGSPDASCAAGIVDPAVSDVKTEYSRAGIRSTQRLPEVLLNWQRTTEFAKPRDWILASPFKAGLMARQFIDRCNHRAPQSKSALPGCDAALSMLTSSSVARIPRSVDRWRTKHLAWISYKQSTCRDT